MRKTANGIPALVVLASVILSAATSPAYGAESKSWTGYLIDRTCASTQHDSDMALNFAKGHTRECALIAGCLKSGYEVLVDGKWVALDANGNKMAEQLLRSTKTPQGLRVKVDGFLKGNEIAASKITEVAK